MKKVKCLKCKKNREGKDFYKDARHRNGLQSHCKVCFREMVKTWQLKNRDRIIVTLKKYRESHKSQHLQTVKKWAKNNIARVKVSRWATGQVRVAIRKGILFRPNVCEKCHKRDKIQAAHGDYSKPLKVRWLCISCHTRWDRKPKTLSYGTQQT